MKKQDINKGWEFMYGEPPSIPMMPVKKKPVDLPYDFMIETDVSADSVSGAATGYYKGSTGSYTKYLEIREEDLARKHVLAFDGCYGITRVVVNGHVACRHHYGYTPFEADLTPYLSAGRNRITVTASNTNEPNSRWYSGAGLYRKVTLLTSPKTHIANNGIYTYTQEIGDSALQAVETTIRNEDTESKEVKVSVELVEKTTGRVAATAETVAAVEAGAAATAKTELTVEQPKLWDIDCPNLYIARVTITAEDMTDEVAVQCGIRTVQVNAKEGLKLNGRPLKLKGGCIHHDNGIVGAAAFRDAEYRKVMLHKQAGFNALRFAHNPVSVDMMNACDEIGMLCIAEAFDTWVMEKNYHDFSNFFEKEWKQELRNMLLRDRNHPSVFMWSIGNEVVEQGGLSDGYRISAELAAYARELDSTRPVGGSICSFFHGLDDKDNDRYWKSIMANRAKLMENGMTNLDCDFGREIWDPYTAPFVKDWDVVGYNYLCYHYESGHEKHPDRVICGSESKPAELGVYWDYVEKLPYLIGDFEWTSMDYIGEAGIGNTFYVEPSEVPVMRQKMFYAAYPARTAEAGNFDICGFQKPQLGYKKAVWGSNDTFLVTYDPSVFGKVELLGRYGWGRCEHSWSWPAEQGAPIKAEVYSRAPEVELLVNGVSVGKKAAGKENDYRAVFTTTYEKGEIVAISRNEKGEEISRDSIKTFGEPVGVVLKEDETLKLLREQGYLPVDEESLNYFEIQVVDEAGNVVPYAEREITAEELGLQNLIALGSGRATTEENYTCGKITTYRGKALAITRKG